MKNITVPWGSLSFWRDGGIGCTREYHLTLLFWKLKLTITLGIQIVNKNISEKGA